MSIFLVKKKMMKNPEIEEIDIPGSFNATTFTFYTQNSSQSRNLSLFI